MTDPFDRFAREYPEQLLNGSASIFVGAGVSMAAGYPSWGSLLREIGEELGVNPATVQDLAALAQWSVTQNGGSYTRIRQVIRDEIGVNHPVPDVLRTIARLPLRHIWTTNYDRLIERSFEEARRPLNVISIASDLAIRARGGSACLYKMHGSVDRLDSVVISTDDYELFRKRRGDYLPLLQAHLTSMSMLFVGISFNDPNIRHVLSLIREGFHDNPPEHFSIVRKPARSECGSDGEFEARSRQHRLWADDLGRYGLRVVEVDDYAEIPRIIGNIERRVAQNRILVSGSWPIEHESAAKNFKIAEGIGGAIGDAGLTLVSGFGSTVGSGALEGFISALRRGGGWELDSRLIARPFPQNTGDSITESWKCLREELARTAGITVFVGGAKFVDGQLVVADGVLEEARLSEANGNFLVPIGMTGGAAAEISNRLISSSKYSARPSDEELSFLANPSASTHEIVELVGKILLRASK